MEDFHFPFPLIRKQEFVNGVRAAIHEDQPYAAGKIGDSEKRWMYYPRVLVSNPTPRQRREYEQTLPFEFFQQSGTFPPSIEFIRTYAEFFVEQVKQLDCVGLF